MTMFRIISLLFLFYFQFIFSNLPPPAQLFCPTYGTSAFVLVTISPNLDINAFGALLEFYAKLMPFNSTEQISYDFYFGTNYTQIIRTNSLQNEINEWVHDNNYLQTLYSSSLVDNRNMDQFQNIELVNIAKSVLDQISKVNQVDTTVFMKKQVVLLTDYVPWNITDVFNSNINENTQILGIFHEINDADFDKAAEFPVFSMEDTDTTNIRKIFQQNINFEFPVIIHEDKPQANILVFMTSANTTDLIEVVDNSIKGSTCQLTTTKMYSKFIQIQLVQNDTNWELILPWLGTKTKFFNKNCLTEVENSSPTNCTEIKGQIIENFVTTLEDISNTTFAYLFIDDVSCTNVTNLKATVKDTSHIRLVMSQDLNSIYDIFTRPLESLGFLDKSIDNQVIYNSQYYLNNHSTSCSDEIPMISLLPSRPYHKPKYLFIAIDDLITICICATISVTTFGILLYCHVRRRLKKQVELLNEILLQPRIYRAPKECAKVQRLPWEIKSENVHIDTEFLLGEGTISNVYLGKLKGKAPIMQWIDRIEMKQYQDCAVAVRVPRHFDEPEEDQLQREIASMRQLRHHDHIALLLGWTNKNDLVCSLLELTHMNLIKYLSQIKETTEIASKYAPLNKIPFQTLYKIIYETCDGIEYIHSRNLIHRDLTARNILLTTGLRAKISGFGFCSEPDDPKFMSNSLALRYLPVRWLAPECFNGKFSFKTDSWAFGVLMYEMFTLGDQPYEDLLRPEEIIESVRKNRIPAHPKYASKQTYKIMQGCFETFSSRRPTFTQLKCAFQTHSTNTYSNPAFEAD
ncbi:unnamed protein product [Caenorhabditis angaria]|uniref:Protein kinase domain-containing protein n=1 Tax=Caenorhabditis angaria TaxID=860376 RepID=A0A9P1IE56_9PELO|nr:unnamed protein product [Caenorhabditis angaria]